MIVKSSVSEGVGDTSKTGGIREHTGTFFAFAPRVTMVTPIPRRTLRVLAESTITLWSFGFECDSVTFKVIHHLNQGKGVAKRYARTYLGESRMWSKGTGISQSA